MSSVILDIKKDKELDPVIWFKEYYNSLNQSCKFMAKTKSEAEEWQIRTTKEFNKVIGFQDILHSEFNPQEIEEVDRGDHIRRKITIQTLPGHKLPVYLLIPKKVSPKNALVLAFHGHGYGVKDIVGLWSDGSERFTPDGYHSDFGIELVRKGFIVAAPEIMGFGEHITDQSYLNSALYQQPANNCFLVSSWAMHLGGSAMGLRVAEAKILLDYLITLDFVDKNRIGAMGISGGGAHTFFSMCSDRRIRAGVISGYFGSWLDNILSINHCVCNFIPNVLNVCDLPDLAALLAPRPVLVEAGTHDGIFPIQAVRRDIKKLQAIYGLWDAKDKVELDEFEGRHRISGVRAYDFLLENLYQEKP